MYPTAEVRWFYRGPIPSEIEAWFRQGAGEIRQERPREDRYLRPSDTDSIGIKLREGRIEIKQRVGRSAATRFHDQVTGAVERWRKWSFQLAELGSARWQIADPPAAWITVGKERQLRTFQLERGRDIIARSSSQTPAQGCELELASVHAAGETWWTLALEAFGDEPALRDTLLTVAEYVFRVREPPPLQVSDSCGYAAWLISLVRTEARE